MSALDFRLPWDGQPQGITAINRSNPIGALTENLWVPGDLSGVALGLGTRTPAHADVRIITRNNRLAFYNNNANEVGTAASILPLTFPWFQFCQFYVDSVPGFVATIPTMISGSGSNSFIQCGSSNLVSAGCRFNFGTQRYCDITITGASGTGLLLSAVFIVRSATDQVFYCNGLSATNTLSPGTLGTQLSNVGSPLGTMNGAVLISGYGRGTIDPGYAQWLSNNPYEWLDLIEPQLIEVPAPSGGGGPATYTLAISGGFALSGGAALVRERVLAAGGNVAFSGAVPLVRNRVLAAGGTVQLNGDVPLVRNRVLGISGSAQFSGSAPMTFIPAGGSAAATVNRLTTGVSREIGLS